jgi:hypothetical protein
MATRLFISFDYDNDSDLKTLLVGQAKNPDTPFEIADWSIKEHITGDWEEKARTRIKAVDCVCVICGEKTSSATGVAAELKIAIEEEKPLFFLWGRSEKTCVKPAGAAASDRIYKWTWDNLKGLIAGAR